MVVIEGKEVGNGDGRVVVALGQQAYDVLGDSGARTHNQQAAHTTNYNPYLLNHLASVIPARISTFSS